MSRPPAPHTISESRALDWHFDPRFPVRQGTTPTPPGLVETIGIHHSPFPAASRLAAARHLKHCSPNWLAEDLGTTPWQTICRFASDHVSLLLLCLHRRRTLALSAPSGHSRANEHTIAEAAACEI